MDDSFKLCKTLTFKERYFLEFNKILKVPKGFKSYKGEQDVQFKMSSMLSGLYTFDVISGLRTQAKGAKFQIKGFYPPSKLALDRIRQNEIQFKRLLLRLKTLPFFVKASLEEIDYVLYKHQTDNKDLYIDDTDVKVQLLDIGQSDFKEYTDLDFFKKAMKEFVPLKQLSNNIPRQPGQKGLKGRMNLMFRPGLWETDLYVDRFHDNVDGWDLTTQKIIKCKKALKLSDETFLHFDCLQTTKQTKEYLINLTKNKTKIDLSWLTPAGLKSLLQKLIRFRCKRVQAFGKMYNAQDLVEYTFIELYCRAGSFVPDLQKFVSGAESAFKRLFVSIYEDSWAKDVDLRNVIVLADVLQNTSYYPCDELILQACRLCKESQETFKSWAWKTQVKRDLKTVHGKNALSLEAIKSFKSDIQLINYISYNPDKLYTNKNRPDIMPIIHCIDQHWVTDLVYHFDLKDIDVDDSQSFPFQSFLRDVFIYVTGVNPRKPRGGYGDDFEEREFIKKVRGAQQSVLDWKTKNKSRKLNKNVEKKIGKYRLTNTQLSGMVKTLKINATAFAILDPTTLDFVVYKTPSRTKYVDFTDAKKQQLYKQLKTQIKNKKHKNLNYKDSTLLFKGYPLEKFRNRQIPIYQIKNHPIETPPVYYKDSITQTKEYVPSREMAGFLNSFGDYVVFPGISRVGGGTKEFVSIQDIKRYKEFLKFVNAWPGLFVPITSLKFKIANVYLLKQILSEIKIKSNDYKIKLPKDTDKRKMYDYQQDALDQLVQKYESGYPANFLNARVGLGKTLIVLKFARYIVDHIPAKYIIYTLPSSAISSIINEIKMQNIPFKLCVPLKSLPKSYKDYENAELGWKPLKDGITLIEHDHLKRLKLIPEMSQSFFIVDDTTNCR